MGNLCRRCMNCEWNVCILGNKLNDKEIIENMYKCFQERIYDLKNNETYHVLMNIDYKEEEDRLKEWLV